MSTPEIERTVTTPVASVAWVFGEATFKRLLGITDPGGILRVSVDFETHSVSVQMART